jgi:hypothetical protein
MKISLRNYNDTQIILKELELKYGKNGSAASTEP